jgi:hypothetical protein
VKKNDVATMERVLAGDFVLVTGNGRKQTKADLLKESSSGEITYVHQEDTDRAVRVWNDNAVVTALLWENGAQKGRTSIASCGSAMGMCARLRNGGTVCASVSATGGDAVSQPIVPLSQRRNSPER